MKRKSIIILLWVTLGNSLFFFFFFDQEMSVRNFFLTFLISAMYSFSIGVGNGVINDFLNKKFPWSGATNKRAIISIVSILATNLILVYFCNYMNYVMIQKVATTEQFFSGKYNFINWFMVNIALLISAFLHAKSFMEELKKSSRKEVVEQKLIAKSANAQFESLKNQLDPHFLFNSLNVLSSLIDENPAKAQKFTASMSKIYRYVLEQKDKELVSVEEELSFAKTYMNLLKMRFENSLFYELPTTNINPEAKVVPLSLQLLLENTVKHNVVSEQRPLHIRIFLEGDYLAIQNDYQKKEILQERKGVGLQNIINRYGIITNRKVLIEQNEKTFTVKIPVLTKQISIMETAANYYENTSYYRAKKRVQQLKGFYGNLISYCCVIPILIFVNLTYMPQFHWFWFSAAGWGFGLTMHAFQTFGYGANWEERKIQEILNKEDKKQTWN